MTRRRWIAGAVRHPGALHRATHTPAGRRIPVKKIRAAARGAYGPKARARARLALRLRAYARRRRR